MRINDALIGSLLIVLAGALWFGSANLPNPAMQPYGPGFFPRILAILLALASAVLLAKTVREHQPIIGLDPWTRQPRAVVRVLLVPAAVMLFVFGMAPFGFLVCAATSVAAIEIADEVPLPTALTVAVALALAVHTVFYVLLNVQLPWGVFAPIRW